MDNLTLRILPLVSDRLSAALHAFLLSREAMRCTPKTLEHYRYTVGSFVAFLRGEGVTTLDAITSGHIRAFLVALQRRGVKDTTQHAHARGVKTFLRWLVSEGELDTSPMERVPMPRLDQRMPAPFTLEDITTLLNTCAIRTAKGARDYALILALLDTGLRASELLSLRVGDIDLRSGLTTVLGKGRKARQVRFGAKARGAVVKMLGFRPNAGHGAPLWTTCDRLTGQLTEEALSLRGLQTILHRLGAQAGVMPCAPHRFRRTFALAMLRDGCDLHSLRLLMGHATLDVLQRYLALAGEDVERAHRMHSPADRLLGR